VAVLECQKAENPSRRRPKISGGWGSMNGRLTEAIFYIALIKGLLSLGAQSQVS
jgi:hypothetical protein